MHQCAISIIVFFFTLAELLNMTVSLSGKGWWYWINLQGLSLSWRCWLHYVACSLALLYLILPGIILSRQSNPIRREIRRRIWLISKKKTYWKRKHSHVSVRIHKYIFVRIFTFEICFPLFSRQMLRNYFWQFNGIIHIGDSC